MTTQIVATRLHGDDRLAMVETAALLLLALLGLVLLRRTEGRAGQAGARKGVGPAPPRRLAAVPRALAAAALSRCRVRARGLLEGLLAMPWAVPGAVVAIALATTFSVQAPLVGRFVLVGTLWILPLACLVRNLRVARRADRSRLPCCAPRSPRAPVSPS